MIPKIRNKMKVTALGTFLYSDKQDLKNQLITVTNKFIKHIIDNIK